MDDLENERQKVAYYHRRTIGCNNKERVVTKESGERAEEKSGLAPLSEENQTQEDERTQQIRDVFDF